MQIIYYNKLGMPGMFANYLGEVSLKLKLSLLSFKVSILTKINPALYCLVLVEL